MSRKPLSLDAAALSAASFFGSIVLILLLVAACGGKPSGPVDVSSNGDFTEQVITLKDGRHVPCVFWVSGQGLQTNTSGMSCDWGNAK